MMYGIRAGEKNGTNTEEPQKLFSGKTWAIVPFFDTAQENPL